MVKKFKVLLIIALTCTLLLQSATATTPLDNQSQRDIITEYVVTVRCYTDAAYRELYSNYLNTAQLTMTYVTYPFYNKWSISFTPYFYTSTYLPASSCPNGNGNPCTLATCGTVCNNTIGTSTNNHHKNMYRNFAAMKNAISTDGPLVLFLSGDAFCSNYEGSHSTGILGLADTYGTYAFVENNTTRGMMLNVRVIQHELSHLYGCHDKKSGSCATACIMSGGYDNTYTYNLSTIWCTACAASFDRTLHIS